jgi:TonB family protein
MKVALLMASLCTFSTTYAQSPQQQDSPSSPKIVRKSDTVFKDSAIKRVEPVYPSAAKAARVGGTVVVEVIVDEEGEVVAAKAVSGHPLLVDVAITAARGWRFKPATLQGAAARVIGAITFNFKLESVATASSANAERYVEPNVAEIPKDDKKCGDEINRRSGNLVKAISFALNSLREGTYLFEDILKTELPSTILAINILDEKGIVIDSTTRGFVGKRAPGLPRPEDTMLGQHSLQLETNEGIRWIVIVTRSP